MGNDSWGGYDCELGGTMHSVVRPGFVPGQVPYLQMLLLCHSNSTVRVLQPEGNSDHGLRARQLSAIDALFLCPNLKKPMGCIGNEFSALMQPARGGCIGFMPPSLAAVIADERCCPGGKGRANATSDGALLPGRRRGGVNYRRKPKCRREVGERAACNPGRDRVMKAWSRHPQQFCSDLLNPPLGEI